MGWIWIAAITFLFILHQWRNLSNKKKLPLPPGPKGLPIIGHIHLLGKNPHQDLYNLARKHGPIMYTRFGFTPVIVVSSPSAAKLFLKTYDHIFANRSHHEFSHLVAYEQRNIVFGRYGPYWRNMRKLCTVQLMSGLKIRQFKPMRKAEIWSMVDSLRKAAASREVVDLSAMIMSVNGGMTCLMVFGRKFDERDLDDRGFKGLMSEAMAGAAAFNLCDYYPYLRWLDLQGSARRFKKIGMIFDRFLERIIDEHAEKKERSHNFVDTLMEIHDSGEAGFEFDRRHIKAVLLDMLLAGMDTSAAAIEWAMADLIKHPKAMNKLQKELEEVVGLNQRVDESHLPSLKYLDCIIKESMRLHPVGPVLAHEAMEDCKVDGFHIPNKSRVLINVWAIGRDPDTWEDPERFNPERFLGSNVDLRGQDFQLIPFSSGRRGCPGLQLGLTIVSLMVAQLVHCFDWELADGTAPTDLDMFEHFGLVMSRANHLKVIPTYKLRV